eukprot:gene6287-8656_t
MSEIQQKEQLSQQELDKVRNSQNKRRLIKALRQEAYQNAANRKKRADDYHMMKLQKQLKDKEDRCNAIKKGFQVLRQMRNGMKDIMLKTTLELKGELDRLYHHDEFTPDAVETKAIAVSKQVLFPRLEKTFGMIESKTEEQFQNEFLFAYNENENNNNNKSNHTSPKKGVSSPDSQNSSKKVNVNFLNALTELESENDIKKKLEAKTLNNLSSDVQSRSGYATLPMKSLTQDKLAMLKLQEEMEQAEQLRRNPHRNGVLSSSGMMAPSTPLTSTHKLTTQLIYNPKQAALDRLRHKEDLRTDVNDKAKFIDPPIGKFRREFSLDHPLAPGGKGKYKSEKSQGKIPTGLGEGIEISKTDVANIIQSNNNDNNNNNGNNKSQEIINPKKVEVKNLKQLKNNAKKIEKLSYAAQTKTVDPSDSIDEIKQSHKEYLLSILDEEKLAEEEREETYRKITDIYERAKLDEVFAEERRRASDRIIKITKEHEQIIKGAILQSMNLGAYAY